MDGALQPGEGTSLRSLPEITCGSPEVDSSTFPAAESTIYYLRASRHVSGGNPANPITNATLRCPPATGNVADARPRNQIVHQLDSTGVR